MPGTIRLTFDHTSSFTAPGAVDLLKKFKDVDPETVTRQEIYDGKSLGSGTTVVEGRILSSDKVLLEEYRRVTDVLLGAVRHCKAEFILDREPNVKGERGN